MPTAQPSLGETIAGLPKKSVAVVGLLKVTHGDVDVVVGRVPEV
jgi:hypothetical protein